MIRLRDFLILCAMGALFLFCRALEPMRLSALEQFRENCAQAKADAETLAAKLEERR